MIWRRLALALLRRVRHWLVPPLPAGSVRYYEGDAGGAYVRELTDAERAEMRETDPRPARQPRRWLDHRTPRWRW